MFLIKYSIEFLFIINYLILGSVGHAKLKIVKKILAIHYLVV